MRIALVSEHASPLARLGSPDAAGQNVYVAALSRSLAELGHDVTVHTRRDDKDLPDQVELAPGVTVHHVSAGPAEALPKDELLPYMPDFGTALARYWGAEPPAVVHSHFWMSGLASLIGARALRLPVVHTYHALGAVKRRYQGRRDTSPAGRVRLERAIANDVGRVVALSSDEVNELLRMGVRRDQLRVVPAGVNTDHFRPDGPVAPTGDQHRVLTVGRLVERKGFDTAIVALRRVPHTELVIAGGPAPDELADDPEYQRLRAVAEREGVADRVRFLGGVDHAVMPELIRSADVVACVPWYEPFGIVPLEAMACGVPVVTSAVGGFLDTVVDGSTGTTVPPRRPDLLAEALRKLISDPFRREGFGIAGVDRVRSRYSWERVARDMMLVYENELSPAHELSGVPS